MNSIDDPRIDDPDNSTPDLGRLEPPPGAEADPRTVEALTAAFGADSSAWSAVTSAPEWTVSPGLAVCAGWSVRVWPHRESWVCVVEFTDPGYVRGSHRPRVGLARASSPALAIEHALVSTLDVSAGIALFMDCIRCRAADPGQCGAVRQLLSAGWRIVDSRAGAVELRRGDASIWADFATDRWLLLYDDMEGVVRSTTGRTLDDVIDRLLASTRGVL